MIVCFEFTFSLLQEVVPCLNRMRAISWRAERLEIGSVIVDLLPATQAGYVAFPPAVDQSEISTYVVCFRPSREKLGMRILLAKYLRKLASKQTPQGCQSGKLELCRGAWFSVVFPEGINYIISHLCHWNEVRL
jgi:hypothetical protein